MCQQCDSAVATITCAQCNESQCTDCDRQVHAIKDKATHTRKPSTAIPSRAASATSLAPKPSTARRPSTLAAAAAKPAPSATSMCEQCESRVASVSCAQCQEKQCADCDAQVHAAKGKSDHTRKPIVVTAAASTAPTTTSKLPSSSASSKRPSVLLAASAKPSAESSRSMCDHCESIVAAVACAACNAKHCVDCDKHVHAAKSKMGHTRKALSAPAAAVAASAAPASSPARPRALGGRTSSAASLHLGGPRMCEVCQSHVAFIRCDACGDKGFFCSDCDIQEHKSKVKHDHERKPMEGVVIPRPPVTPPKRASATGPILPPVSSPAAAGALPPVKHARRASGSLRRDSSPSRSTRDRPSAREADHSPSRSSNRRASGARSSAQLDQKYDGEGSARHRAATTTSLQAPRPTSAARSTSADLHSTRPIEVAVRHRSAAGHAARPPATSPEHTSWEEELAAQLRHEEQITALTAAATPSSRLRLPSIPGSQPSSSPIGAQRHLSIQASTPSHGAGAGGYSTMPSPAASPLRSPSPDSDNEQSFSPVGGAGNGEDRQQRVQRHRAASTGAASAATPSSASSSSSPGFTSSVSSIPPLQPLRLHAPAKLNLSPDFKPVEAGESCLTLFTGTWNLHAKPFPSNLEEFIPPNAFDIYVLGTEECEASIEASMIFSSKARWVKRLTELLGDGYVEVAQQTLQAIHIIAFVRTALFQYVHHIEHGAVATGIGDVVGNKGGVALGFDISKTSLLFINAHFAAHQHATAQRNADYLKILSKLPFKSKMKESNPHLSLVSDRFTRVWFMGDLNYRVTGNRRMVDALVQHRMIEVMLANDQLNLERAAGRVFKGFIEAYIHFMPTYKFDHASDRYDSSKKQRIPSYTDRILWKPTPSIQCLRYDSVESVRTSDHRPVFATFNVKIKQRAEKDDGKLKKFVMGTSSGSKACVIQ